MNKGGKAWSKKLERRLLIEANSRKTPSILDFMDIQKAQDAESLKDRIRASEAEFERLQITQATRTAMLKTLEDTLKR